MARVLHLLTGGETGLAVATIERQLASGDEVTVTVTRGAPPSVPAGVHLHRVPAEWSYDQLLEAIFLADHVVTW